MLDLILKRTILYRNAYSIEAWRSKLRVNDELDAMDKLGKWYQSTIVAVKSIR